MGRSSRSKIWPYTRSWRSWCLWKPVLPCQGRVYQIRYSCQEFQDRHHFDTIWRSQPPWIYRRRDAAAVPHVLLWQDRDVELGRLCHHTFHSQWLEPNFESTKQARDINDEPHELATKGRTLWTWHEDGQRDYPKICLHHGEPILRRWIGPVSHKISLKGIDMFQAASSHGGKYSPSLFRFRKGLGVFIDDSKKFQTYLRNTDTQQVATSHGMRMRTKHYIHPKVNENLHLQLNPYSSCCPQALRVLSS